MRKCERFKIINLIGCGKNIKVFIAFMLMKSWGGFLINRDFLQCL